MPAILSPISRSDFAADAATPFAAELVSMPYAAVVFRAMPPLSLYVFCCFAAAFTAFIRLMRRYAWFFFILRVMMLRLIHTMARSADITLFAIFCRHYARFSPLIIAPPPPALMPPRFAAAIDY